MAFVSPSGILIDRVERSLDYTRGVDFLVEQLDRKRGCFLASGVADEDRYTRFDLGFIDPPVELLAYASDASAVLMRALNDRGVALLAMLAAVVREHEGLRVTEQTERALSLRVVPSARAFSEEQRSRQPSAFTPLRALLREFLGFDDPFLGLYGAFGYDLLYAFDSAPLRHARSARDKLYHLYLPDRVLVCDRQLERARAYEYEFSRRELSTVGRGDAAFTRLEPAPQTTRNHHGPPEITRERGPAITSDCSRDDYMAMVERARERMRVGDIFEVVLSREFHVDYAGPASALYQLMRRINPSPYEFFLQLGDEQLVGASPEMFVRVQGDRVESSPISGTARRGQNAMEDADNILGLLNSRKDEVELTMCTDVDRNDKARICVPGSVVVLARRKIERYAGLFHTVDHVEGRLRPGFDGLDAFSSHMWAVTLTGAPKRMAASIIEHEEASPRRWYGGSVGALSFDGGVNTCITIRTAHLEAGRARYRAGATLVWDSDPSAEEAETQIKATAFFRAMERLGDPLGGELLATEPSPSPHAASHAGARVVMIDNEDSFVHTLADYLRQTGAAVTTFRHDSPALSEALALSPDLVVHSPGPGRPADFRVPERVRELADAGVPQLGVCLGLQGMVEAFGGELAVLDEPRHGKHWQLQHDGDDLFRGLPSPLRVGAYHSLYAAKVPARLQVIARNEHGTPMAIREGRALLAVQFHPESILSMTQGAGLQIIRNALDILLAK